MKHRFPQLLGCGCYDYTLRTDAESLTRQRATRQWWNRYVDLYILTSSDVVIFELSRGKHEVKKARLNLIKNIELFESSNEIQKIVQVYIDRLVMPHDPFGDAHHLAIASFHKLDALLTWNCLHLANPNKLDVISQINHELGLPTPELITPLTYYGGTD